MGTYQTKYNPFSKSLQWVLDANLLKIKGTVDTQGDLPLTGNSENDCYIVKDTDRLYTWSIPASSGTLDKWLDVGSSSEIDWSVITNKPSSSVEDIDDAVDKKHTQNTDTKLDEDGTNEVSASELVSNIYNTILLAFKVAIQGSLTIFNMIDGFVDEYEDESGIDNDASLNEVYDEAEKVYKPVGGDIVRLALHCDGIDESTIFTDASPSEHGNATVTGDAQVDTAQKKWGTGSLMLDGTDSIYYGDSADWDIFASDSDDWTIDFWFKPNDHTIVEDTFFMTQWQSGTYRWAINYHGGTAGNRGFSSWYIINDVTHGMSSPGSPLSDNNWHHLALVKVGDEQGLYLDGVQINYVQDSSIYNYSAPLYIGNYSGLDAGFKGYMDEIRIQHANIFNASPNSGKTDTIVVPTSASSSYENITLISDTQIAESEPSSARIVIFEEDVDSITLNTDLKAYISKDDGDTWAEVTLEDEGDYDITRRILVGNADLTVSGIGSGTDMRYKLDGLNNKGLKFHGTGLLWDV